MKVHELASFLGLTNEQLLNVIKVIDKSVQEYTDEIDTYIQEKLIGSLYIQEESKKRHDNRSTLKYLKIYGLFDKYNYEINFENDVNIFIAENGFGKTTILNILVSLLNADKRKLAKLPFKIVKITLEDKEICINKSELIDSNIEKDTLCKYRFKNKDNKYYKKLNEKIIGEIDNIDEPIEDYIENKIREMYYISKNNDTINAKLKQIKDILQEEVLYFPTYRRIEVGLEKVISNKNGIKLLGENSHIKDTYRNYNVKFGMEDVEYRISELTSKLKEDAILAYSKMSADIINDLLLNKTKLNKYMLNQIDSEKIKIIIGRIGKENIQHADRLIDVDKVIESNNENSKFLMYYLFKLNEIYEAQKPIDDKIKKYRDVCNNYLVNKEVYYDEVNTSVKIIDSETRKEVDFIELSSGEKQILSLFSILYFDITKPVIFIIDEPELSLSIVWQKRLLTDIYDSGRVKLLIATTHSPFIFKNDFREFVSEVELHRKGKK